MTDTNNRDADGNARPAPFFPVDFPSVWVVRPDFVNILQRTGPFAYRLDAVGLTFAEVGQEWGGN